jgi:hypothetical protein
VLFKKTLMKINVFSPIMHNGRERERGHVRFQFEREEKTTRTTK